MYIDQVVGDRERRLSAHQVNLEIFSSMYIDQVVGDRERRLSAHQASAHESRNVKLYVQQ